MEGRRKAIRLVSIERAHLVRLVLVLSGVLSFAASIFLNSQVLAFIGLGLAFWGALFFLITPRRYVEGSLLGNSTISTYKTVSRIIKDLQVMSHGYYIPPFPKSSYIPDYLKGLKEIVVFIPKSNIVETPSIEEMAKGKFILEKTKGVLIVPPGAGLLDRIEREFDVDFNNMDFGTLSELLPRFMLENFGLAEEMELTVTKDLANVEVTGSLYSSFYSNEPNMESIAILGCPVVSAVACALAKASGRIVVLHTLQYIPTSDQIKAEFSIVQVRE